MFFYNHVLIINCLYSFMYKDFLIMEKYFILIYPDGNFLSQLKCQFYDISYLSAILIAYVYIYIRAICTTNIYIHMLIIQRK